MRRRTLVIVIVSAVVVIVAVPLAAYGYLVWTTRDAPDPAALGPAPRGDRSGGPSQVDGTWSPAAVPTNFVGYRVRERVGPVSAPSDAVGRTREVEGAVTIADARLTALDVRVDMASITSGSSNRDETVRDEAFETGAFPTAQFSLADRVDLGDPRRGRVIDVQVPGRLTLRDVTREVTFDVQGRWDGPTIQIAGSTDVQRSDFGIAGGGFGGFSVGDTATIEFELTLAPEGVAVEQPQETLVESPDVPFEDPLEDVPPCVGDGLAPPLGAPVLVTTGTNLPAVLVVTGSDQHRAAHTSAGLLAGATWSPDGSEILLAESSTPAAATSLAVVPGAGGAPTALPPLGDVEQPDWGPDGEIVFVKEEEDGSSDIWIADADGANARPLLVTPGDESEPRWSPDGRRVVFTTLAGAKNQDVMIVRRDGRGLRALASSEAYEYAPSFSPDGKTVLFARDGALHSIGVDGDDGRRLTDGTHDANPALSPDGRQLAFVRGGSLYVADADGSNPSCVVTGQPLGAGPRWQQSGESRRRNAMLVP